MEVGIINETVDISNCDSEPIHIPGNIQPHGILFAVDPEKLIVTRVSLSVERILHTKSEDILGQKFEKLLAERSKRQLSDIFSRFEENTKPQSAGDIYFVGADEVFECVAHSAGWCVIIECEPKGEFSPDGCIDLQRQLSSSINQLEKTELLSDFYKASAEVVRAFTGFDRVMVYKFDEDWHGEVIGESKRENLETFLGLHYPASDIPVQARLLYTKNTLRFIPNREYQPSQIVPSSGPADSSPLDLSLSVLRSVSPIHLEYLKNMGVVSSMSISLLINGRLWGLIACHNYSPRFVPYPVRTICELFSRFISLEIANREKATIERAIEKRLKLLPEFVSQFVRSSSLSKALLFGKVNVVYYLGVQGAALCLGGEIHRIGLTPSSDDIMLISRMVKNKISNDSIYHTHQLSTLLASSRLDSVASGVLFLYLSKATEDFLIWFKPEQVRVVEWAGDPHKKIKKGDSSRLSPRGSFALWKETIRGQSHRWKDEDLFAAKALRQELLSCILQKNHELDIENLSLISVSQEKEMRIDVERSARLKAENMNRLKDEFVSTLSHELRTPLNAVLGWTQIAVRKANQIKNEELQNALEIIEKSAQAQSQMIDDLLDLSQISAGKLKLKVDLVLLPQLLEKSVQTLEVAAAAKKLSLEINTPVDEIVISGDYQRLQQVIWNLVSNAIKFTPSEGKVVITLEKNGSCAEVSVTDSGKGISNDFLPYIFDKFRQEEDTIHRKYGGLGLGLSIVKNLVELHGGTVRAESPGEGKGARFTVSLPIKDCGAEEIERYNSQQPKLDYFFNLQGNKILVLDDDSDSRKMIRKFMEEWNAEVEDVDNAISALQMLETVHFDLIVSDVGMPGMNGFEFIKKLRTREKEACRKHVPAISLTAYANSSDRSASILAGFRMHLNKPVDRQELLLTAAKILNKLG